MKVVLDTNVIVSAVMTTHGPCAQIIDLFAEGLFDICTDSRILDEYEEVLSRPRLRIDPDDAAMVLELIHAVAETVAAAPLPVRLPDAEDLPFLEVAAGAGALLVTGNTRHYPDRSRAGVTVITPREFLDLLRRSS